jgi:hypothetical protein
LINNRSLGLTRGDAVAVLDFVANCGVTYQGGPLIPLPEPAAEPFPAIKLPREPYGFQCMAISKKTKRRCGQRVTSAGGFCYAHAPKEDEIASSKQDICLI